MIKREELGNPHSCMNRADDDEMTFVLLGRDVAAPNAIRSWAADRVAMGKNHIGDEQIVEALACANAMESWQIKTDKLKQALILLERCYNDVIKPQGCYPLADDIEKLMEEK